MKMSAKKSCRKRKRILNQDRHLKYVKQLQTLEFGEAHRQLFNLPDEIALSACKGRGKLLGFLVTTLGIQYEVVVILGKQIMNYGVKVSSYASAFQEKREVGRFAEIFCLQFHLRV